jgi:hypothetical protein
VSVALACLTGATSAMASPAATTSGQTGQLETTTPTKPAASATLQQCLTAPVASERSATFAGEMTATPTTARMEVRIDVLERMPSDLAYHTVIAPGLGVWRGSAPGVKVYTYLKQITNLTAPAFYRGEVRFRWLNAKGRVIKTSELRTRRCEQTAPETPETETPATSNAPSPATG